MGAPARGARRFSEVTGAAFAGGLEQHAAPVPLYCLSGFIALAVLAARTRARNSVR